MYGDLGTFGTAAMAVVEDSQRIIHYRSFPSGSYYIANSPSLSVDVCYRKFTMTVRQLVMEFGIDSVSDMLNQCGIQASTANGLKWFMPYIKP